MEWDIHTHWVDSSWLIQIWFWTAVKGFGEYSAETGTILGCFHKDCIRWSKMGTIFYIKVFNFGPVSVSHDSLLEWYPGEINGIEKGRDSTNGEIPAPLLMVIMHVANHWISVSVWGLAFSKHRPIIYFRRLWGVIFWFPKSSIELRNGFLNSAKVCRVLWN